MSDRLNRAIRKWAQVTDTAVTDWAVNAWAKELADRPEPEEKVIDAIHYLVTMNQKAHLFTLNRVLETGIPRSFYDRQNMQEVSTEGAQYMRKVWQAMETNDTWGALYTLVQEGKKLAPDVSWEGCERECMEKMRQNTDTE